jgi:CRP-like cAMP-binding protein
MRTDGLITTHKIDKKGNEQILSLLKTGDMFPHTGQFGSSGIAKYLIYDDGGYGE